MPEAPSTPTPPRPARDRHTATVAAWLTGQGIDDAGVDRVLDTIATTNATFAAGAAAATVDLEPGDGWRYQYVLTRVSDPTWPGNLAVALPEHRRCMLVHTPAFCTPEYADEKLDAGRNVAVVTAVLVSLLDL